MFDLLLAFGLLILLGKLIGLVSAKTEEVKQRTRRKH